jgi:hypothetical protein
VGSTAREPSPFVARPWLQQFASGVVARFHPDVEGTERWRLVIADSRGQTVTSYEGHGQPPGEIAWDGRTKAGATVVPGLTYSYVFEAYDRAGNKRNFVGQGFKVSAYRLTSADGPVLVFSARELGESQAMSGATTGFARSPILLEAATWINQCGRPRQPVRVTATARSFDRASELAQNVAGGLASLIMGDPARIQNVAQVEPDAPEEGVVKIAPLR